MVCLVTGCVSRRRDRRYFISAVLGSSEKTQACFPEEVLAFLFIIFLQRSYVRTSLLVSSSLQTSFGVSVTLQLFRGSKLRPLQKPFLLRI
jgi:hypothetical protein